MRGFAEAVWGPWLLGGDFNVVADYKGPSVPRAADMRDFRNCMEYCHLMQPPIVGSSYTWTGVRANGRIWERLDRFLVDQEFLDAFDNVNVHHLSKMPSDHCPILLICETQLIRGPAQF
ncbi:unnamed protein product [Cuscuta epithymum]|uniref:Endonuclease/exonuclease/phosphatase domain-containing protein n=1 Tax=Cuscuta epithymum TaxID=186058 RepID=A0AAV0F5K1_9ASTE|nr:unnamed protein product [Cuscuta epithymum]